MAYSDFLASRGYSRVRVERTEKAPGDLVLHHVARPAERVPDAATTVIAMRGKRARAAGQ